MRDLLRLSRSLCMTDAALAAKRSILVMQTEPGHRIRQIRFVTHGPEVLVVPLTGKTYIRDY